MMKSITTHFRKLALLIAGVVVLFSSCAKDDSSSDMPPVGSDEMVFTLELPNSTKVQTRSVATSEENAIKNLHMLVCEPGGKLIEVVECKNLTAVSGTSQKRWSFKAKLVKGATYDLILVANASTQVATLSKNDPRATVIDKLEVANTAKWTVDGTSEATSIPMWGELNNQAVTESYTAFFNLTRMLAKVNVSLASSVTNFTLTKVYYYNYNTKGYAIPKLDSNNDPVYPATGIQIGADKVTMLYSGADITSGSSCLDKIYVFEAKHVAKYGETNWTQNPCIVVGGSYNGGPESFYRLDFIKTGTPEEWLSIKRNHSYIVKINSVSGKGYGTEEEAYNSAPINMESQVHPWDDNDMKEGVWNGEHFIRFSDMDVRFTQFGDPASHTITIETTLSSLSFENFTQNKFAGNYTAALNEGDWNKSGSTWSNGHFSVQIAGPITNSKGNTEYTLTITTQPAKKASQNGTSDDDLEREAQFSVKGSSLDATITISQDEFAKYKLITSAASEPLSLDGTNQRFKISVTSTYPYGLEFKTSDNMFLGAYTAQVGGTQLYNASGPMPAYASGIPETIDEIWVEVDTYASSIAPRIGLVEISHIDPASTAGTRIHNIIQTTPTITASVNGGVAAAIAANNESVTISVMSNVNGAWTPTLTLDGAAVVTTGLFDPASGTGNGTTVFTPSENTTSTDRVYEIVFKNSDGTVVSNKVTITQSRAALHGIAPTGRIKAIPDILAVDENGVLNLDGRGYIVYFKWNSVIATGASVNAFSSSQIAWAPDDYDYEALVASMGVITGKKAWELIPEHPAIEGYYNVKTNPLKWVDKPLGGDFSDGIGDPCRLAEKDGVVTGEYVTPKLALYYIGAIDNLYFSSKLTSFAWRTGGQSPYGVKGWLNTKDDLFYPVTGLRYGDTGAWGYDGIENATHYWSKTVSKFKIGQDTYNFAWGIYAYTSSGTPSFHAHALGVPMGLAVRCVKE